MTDTVSVVAGGWSVTEVDLRQIPGHVVGVNDSAVYLPRVDSIVSMDRLWTENRASWLIGQAKPTYLRARTVPPELLDKEWVRIYQCDHTRVSFGPTPSHMNGTNSGVVALNLAYTMRPRTLYLFGFDMCRGPRDEAHWHPDYPWNPRASKRGKLLEWSKQFDSIAEEFHRQRVEVINVSGRSKIGHFRRVHPRDLGMWRRAA